MIKIVRTFLRIPFLPFVLIAGIYIIFKAHQEMGLTEFAVQASTNEKQLVDELTDKILVWFPTPHVEVIGFLIYVATFVLIFV